MRKLRPKPKISGMGFTHVTARIEPLNANGKHKPYEALFLVDTGALDCLAPADELRAAGIKPVRKRVYELANGDSVEYEVGEARVRFMGDDVLVRVIFGPEGVEPILGVLALEAAGIVVDPTTNQLKRLHALPLK